MLKSFSFMSALLATAVLLGSNHPNPGSFGISGDYLYLRPSVDDTYFVLENSRDSNFPEGKRTNNDFGYDSGYRVSAVYAFCECDREALLSYSHLSANKSRRVEGNNLWATVGSPDVSSSFQNYAGSASSKQHIAYNRLDPLYAQRFYNYCGLGLRALVGFEYANVKLKTHNNFVRGAAGEGGIQFDVRNKSSAWGFGPQIGLAAEYEICQWTECLPGTLSFNAASTGSLLVGHSRTDVFSNRSGGGNLPRDLTNIKDRKTWRVIPAFHARMELNYETSICAMPTSLAVGYEFNSYIGAIGKTSFYDDVGESLCSTKNNNFDLQGLYVSASVSF